MTNEIVYHVPVLLKESVDGLAIRPDGIYVDVTFGGGGHSKEILQRLGKNGHLYSFDQDADAERNIPGDERFTFVRSNFRYLRNWMRYYGVEQIDGLLADLGVSREIVNKADEQKLADIFYLYGELKSARRIAAAIVKARTAKPIVTTHDLLHVTEHLFQREHEKKDAARMFQALRIEVNHEMDALKEMLLAATDLIKPGGRLSVITYHSLEDRIVKNVMKAGNTEGKIQQDFYGRIDTPFKAVNGKVIVPNNEEQQENPRSRSAKLRIAEKVLHTT